MAALSAAAVAPGAWRLRPTAGRNAGPRNAAGTSSWVGRGSIGGRRGRGSVAAFPTPRASAPAATATRFAGVTSSSRHRVVAAAAAAASPEYHELTPLTPATNLPTNYFKSFDDDFYSDTPPPPPTASLQDILPYLWNISIIEKGIARRLGLAIAAMMVSKGAGLAVPILFKVAVDHLTAAAVAGAGDQAVALSLRAAATVIVWSGVFKAISGVASELRAVAFAPVAQAAGRRVALQVFNHVLNLDLSFHLDRRTGALQRIIDRGTRSVAMVGRAVVFMFMPTAVELVLVCGLLYYSFGPAVVGIVLATFTLYVGWTVHMTSVSAGLRKIANTLDGHTTGKAVDALLNYETVSVVRRCRLTV